jgi:hypothetical protein
MTPEEWIDIMPGNLDPKQRLTIIADALAAYSRELTTAVDAVYQLKRDESTDAIVGISSEAENMARDVRRLAHEWEEDR